MENEIRHAVNYRSLSAHLRDVAKVECDNQRRTELIELSTRYEKLAEKLFRSAYVTKH